MKLIIATLAILFSAFLAGTVSGQQQCGGSRLCPNFLCCSRWGYCGTTEPWCGTNCQSLCWRQERSDHRCGRPVGNPPCGQGRCCSVHDWCGGGNAYCGVGNCQYRCWSAAMATPRDLSTYRNLTTNAVSDIVSEAAFDEMFSHRKDCPSQDFYTYNAFLSAAESFPGFGTTGDVETRTREIAAFLALISQATTGKWSDVEDPHGWGLCHINSTTSENDYCTSSTWPCASGQKYNPRGAIQLVHNSNYGLAGQAIGIDLIKNPDLVATDPIVSFKTAMWLWMSEHDNKPSCHVTLLNSDSSISSGVFGNIVNRAIGVRTLSSIAGFYKRYCDILGVSYGFDFARIQMAVE